MNFTEILESEGLAKQSRPNVIDMTGKTCGRYLVTGQVPKLKGINEACWHLRCQNCGHSRVARGNLIRAMDPHCPNCDPNPCKLQADWPARIESLKDQLRSAISCDIEPREIERLAAALSYAYRRKRGVK